MVLAALAALAAAIAFRGTAVGFGSWPDPSDPATSLGDVEVAVSRHYPVPELTSDQLKPLMARGDVVLFDVREPAEFDVSHIRGARRIDPGLAARSFMELMGSDLKGKQLVFYCSVGVRSGQMAQMLQSTFEAKGARAFNLRGGIFRWYALGGEVVADAGPVQAVHPYDSSWGQLLERAKAKGPGAGR
jgi:rhodanese-related sulfurtransferase